MKTDIESGMQDMAHTTLLIDYTDVFTLLCIDMGIAGYTHGCPGIIYPGIISRCALHDDGN
jgi:hypothetical protein